jgi:hypothetical protein
MVNNYNQNNLQQSILVLTNVMVKNQETQKEIAKVLQVILKENHSMVEIHRQLIGILQKQHEVINFVPDVLEAVISMTNESNMYIMDNKSLWININTKLDKLLRALNISSKDIINNVKDDK